MQSANDVMSFQLPAMMTAETADALTQELIQLTLAQKKHFRFEAARVENFSTVGAQILACLHKSIHQAGGIFELTNDNPRITSILHDIGLDWLMNPPR